MLQAIVRNKARKFLLGGDQRRPVEDVMTACVFGGLRYLTPDVAGAALGWMLGDLVPAGITLTDVRLWPRRDGVEPDVVLLGHLPGGAALQVVVECKWGSNVLTLEQVNRQRAAFADGHGPDAVLLQAFVVQDRFQVEQGLLQRLSDECAGQRLVTWRDVGSALSRARTRHGSAEARRWAEDVSALLDDVGERAFSGDWPRLGPHAPGPGPLFYLDVDGPIRWPSLFVPPAPDVLFYAGRTGDQRR